jgi:hypothetical protein
MLIVKRYRKEALRIGDDIVMQINKVDCGVVTLGLWVPAHLQVTPLDTLEFAKICGIVRANSERSPAPQTQ